MPWCSARPVTASNVATTDNAFGPPDIRTAKVRSAVLKRNLTYGLTHYANIEVVRGEGGGSR